MTPLRKILEELLMPAEIMLRQKGLKVKFSIDLAHQQILALIPKKKQCSSPKYTPEERVSLDMAIDAGDRELEGSLYRQESFEECGGCPECIFNQAISETEQSMNKEE